MPKHARKHQLLVQSVLASTLFLSPAVSYADETIRTSEMGPFLTSVSGDITVTQTGQLTFTVPTDVVLTFDSPNATVTLLEGNVFYNPLPSGQPMQSGTIQPGIDLTGPPPDGSIAVAITSNYATLNIAPFSSVVVGGGTTGDPGSISAPDGIRASGSHASIQNAGYITLQDTSAPYGQNVIHVEIGGDDLAIQNSLTGVIRGGATLNDSVILIDADTSGFTINNAGLITVDGAHTEAKWNFQQCITVNGQFDSIQNSGNILQAQDGTSQPVRGPALLLNADLLSGSLTNNATGTISVLRVNNTDAKTDTIRVYGPMTDIVNHGIIDNLSENGTPAIGDRPGGAAIALDFNGALNSIQNSGFIYSKEDQLDTATIVARNANNTLYNGLSNTGRIVHGVLGNPAIDFSLISAASVENSGNIVGNVLLASTGNSGVAPAFLNTGGFVAGRVIGEATANDLFKVSGGTVVSIENAAGAPTAGNTYAFTGGTIVDYVTLPAINNNVVNLSGSDLNFLTGGLNTNDTFNVSGGSFTILDGNGADAASGNLDQFNVLSSFTSNGQILNMPIVHIQNPGTVFTVNNIITGITQDTLTIDAGTTLALNSIISAAPNQKAVVNNNGTILANTSGAVFDFSNDATTFTSIVNNNAGGTVQIGPEGTLRILGNNISNAQGGNPLFLGQSGSNLNVQINGQCCNNIVYGDMIVNSFSNQTFAVQLLTGSTIQPEFIGFLPSGSLFDIVTVNTGGQANSITIQNNATLIPYPSATVYFGMETLVEGTGASPAPEYTSVIRLTSYRNSFGSLSGTRLTTEVANTLDTLASFNCLPSNVFCTLLSQFDQIPTAEGVEQAMQSLLPGINYGLITASHIGMNNTFEAVTDRVFEFAWQCFHNQLRFPVGNTPTTSSKLRSGTSVGDSLGWGTPVSYWLRPVGNYIDQDMREGIAGYKAKASGLSVGFDWDINDCTMYGIAFSFTKVNVSDKAFAPKNEAVKSWQATVYGAYDFCYGIFMDAMVGFARNYYDTNRVIHVNQLLTGAQASFKGIQWGFQGDLGMALPNTGDTFLAPFLRLNYISLDMQDYAETGALDLNLQVNQGLAKEFYGGVGVKVAREYIWGSTMWVPEFTSLLAYDFHNDAERAVSIFAGSGPAFSTIGVVPGRAIWNNGLALHGICGDSVMSFKYNLDFRNKYVGNSAYLQLYYNWA